MNEHEKYVQEEHTSVRKCGRLNRSHGDGVGVGFGNVDGAGAGDGGEKRL